MLPRSAVTDYADDAETGQQVDLQRHPPATDHTVTKHRVRRLSQLFPQSLTPHAYATDFDALLQDVKLIGRSELLTAGANEEQQWLMVAGWECQNNSNAGS
jgi:hypothetical protein